MNTIYFNKTKYEVPSCYNELSKNQLLKIAAILHGSLEKHEAVIQVLLVLLKVKSNLKLQYQITYLSNEQIYDLAQLTHFVFEKQDGLTNNLIPEFTVSGKTFYGPSDKCGNLVFIELIKAFTFYENYLKTKDTAFLDKLIAVLYRPKKSNFNPEAEDYDGDIRSRYNDHLVNIRAKAIQKLPLPTKQAILLFFDACRERIIKNNPHVFKKAGSGSGASSGNGYADLLRKMAGSPMNYDKMAYVPAATALFDLNETIAEDKERERKSKLKK